jgi:hypothetical protein
MIWDQKAMDASQRRTLKDTLIIATFSKHVREGFGQIPTARFAVALFD